MKRLTHQSYVFLIFLSFFNLLIISELSGQEKAELSAADKKKLEKADKESEKSAQKYKEADKIYSDVNARQAELTSEESDKLNNKAVVKQIESLEIEYEARKMRYDVYAARVELFWMRNPGSADNMAYAKSLDNGAKAEFSVALDLFKEHENVSDNLMKLSKLSDANDNMGKAFDKMKQAFDLCANPSEAATMAPPAVAQDTVVPAPVTEAPKIDSVVTEPTPAPIAETTPEPVQAVETPVAAPQAEVVPEPAPSTPVETIAPVAEPVSAPVIQEEPVIQKAEVQAPAYQSSISGSGDYRVQIAASRVPLNEEQLMVIYSGSEKPEENLIGEWYKYSIGSFTDYQTAADFRDACGVNGAFVIRP